MLETRKERIKLLKAGISAKNIENLYVESNDMKIINGNLLHTNELIN